MSEVSRVVMSTVLNSEHLQGLFQKVLYLSPGSSIYFF